jgi:putative NADH-flavin reductase
MLEGRTTMSHLILLGATGRTGRLAVAYALAEGHTVTALVREPAKLAARPGLTLVTGTPARETDIEKAFAGAVPADGVVVALNNVRTSEMPWAGQVSPPRFMADAVRYTTDAMKRHGVERIAVVSAIGDSLAVMPFYLRWLIKCTNLGKTYADHNLVDAEIRTTQTAWTLVRAAGLSNSDKPKALVSRRAVARFAVDAALGGGWAGRAPIIWEKWRTYPAQQAYRTTRQPQSRARRTR